MVEGSIQRTYSVSTPFDPQLRRNSALVLNDLITQAPFLPTGEKASTSVSAREVNDLHAEL
jgi:hypothetical protein